MGQYQLYTYNIFLGDKVLATKRVIAEERATADVAVAQLASRLQYSHSRIEFVGSVKVTVLLDGKEIIP